MDDGFKLHCRAKRQFASVDMMIIMMLSNWMQEQVTFLIPAQIPGCKLGSSASYCKSGLLKQQQEQRGYSYSTLTEIFLAMKFFFYQN